MKKQYINRLLTNQYLNILFKNQYINTQNPQQNVNKNANTLKIAAGPGPGTSGPDRARARDFGSRPRRDFLCLFAIFVFPGFIEF